MVQPNEKLIFGVLSKTSKAYLFRIRDGDDGALVIETLISF
jgi:hypothetical protein